MKNLHKILLLLSIVLFIGSCNKNPGFVDESEQVPVDESKPVISLSASIINNNLTDMDLHDETAPDVDLTINGHSFCYGTDITSYENCKAQNINNFENVFGETAVFKVGNIEMNFYCPEMIYFDAPQTIDPGTGFDITWNVDENNNNDVLISIIPRIDGNGSPYTSKNTNRVDIITSDNGNYSFSPQNLSNLHSGDIVDIVMIRGNNKKFNQYYLEAFTVNVHVAMVQ